MVYLYREFKVNLNVKVMKGLTRDKDLNLK